MSLVVTCIHCGKPFTVKRVREANKFCSQACYHADLSNKGRPDQRAETVNFRCATCQKPFSFTVGRLRAYRKAWDQDPLYCSRNCSNVGRTDTETRPCANCGTPFTTSGHSRNRTGTCSDACRRTLQRQSLIARNERVYPSETREIQRKTIKGGYIRLRFPNKNGVKGREVLEHRYVMEQKLGRELHPEETVHHRLKPVSNNDPGNLELFSSRHGPGQRVHEQVTWALDLIQTYPEFAREAGYALTPIATPLDDLFNEGAATDKAH